MRNACSFSFYMNVLVFQYLSQIKLQFNKRCIAFGKCFFSSSCFHNRGYTQNGNDKKFFEYLRSLVVVHPVETSRHTDYIPKEDIMHICPFVLSSDSIGVRLLAMTKKKKKYCL